MRRRLFGPAVVGLLALVPLGLGLLAFGPMFRPPPAPDGAGGAVTHFTLDNGMEAVVIEDRRAPIVTHMVWYRVGAADEPPGRSGIAHFLEHMMFRGSKNFPDGAASRIIAENGGVENAFTSWDYTGYHQTIAADRLELAMELESDRMANPIIDAETAATERKVIVEERNQRTDNSPQALFIEQMRAALWQNHPYGVPIIGWRHEILALSAEDMTAFHERHYGPGNAVLVVAGGVSPETVRELAERHYGGLKPSARPPDPRPTEPPQLAPRRIAMTDPRVRQPLVMRQYLVPAYRSESPKDAAALHLLAEVLGGGIASRLAARLQLEDKTAIATGGFYSPSDRDATGFGVYAVPAPGADLARVEDGLDAVIAEVAENGPDAEDLARIKRRIRADLIFARDSARRQARLYGAALATGRTVADVQNWPDAIESVTVADVRAAAGLLDLDASVTGWLQRGESR